MEDTDIIKIAIDLRYASHFERFWVEQGNQDQGADSERLNRDDGERPSSLDRDRPGAQRRDPRDRENLRRGGLALDRDLRYRDPYRRGVGSNILTGTNSFGGALGPGRNPRESINLLMNANNEVMFFNSPCKFHFAFNGSDFHEGIDLNLINLKESPINLCISLPEHKGVEMQMSRAVYFCDWELIPKEPFLLKDK